MDVLLAEQGVVHKAIVYSEPCLPERKNPPTVTNHPPTVNWTPNMRLLPALNGRRQQKWDAQAVVQVRRGLQLQPLSRIPTAAVG